MNEVMSIFLYPTELSENNHEKGSWKFRAPRGTRNASNLWNRAHLSA